MGTFLHACHLARIDRGELERTTGIIEHYLNQEGRIEVTPQFWNNSNGSWLFGGTLLNLPANLYRPVWCHACDFTGTGIGRPEGF